MGRSKVAYFSARAEYGYGVVAKGEDRGKKVRLGYLDQMLQQMAVTQVDAIEDADGYNRLPVWSGVCKQLVKVHSGNASLWRRSHQSILPAPVAAMPLVVPLDWAGC